MSGGGSVSKSNQKSESAPWIGQQPFLTDVFSQAQGLYNQGVPSYYPGAGYVGFNDIQQGAMDATVGRAGGSPQEGMFGQWLGQTMGQPQFDLTNAGMGANTAINGINPAMQNLFGQGGPSLGGGMGASRFGTNPFSGNQTAQQGFDAGGKMAAAGGVSGLLGQKQGFSDRMGDVQGGFDPTAMGTLQASARGDMLNKNPFLEDTFNRASQRVRESFNDTVMPGINSTFGGAGRTGSELHKASVGQAGEDLSDTLGNLATDIYGTDYAQERDRQLASANQLNQFGLGAGGLASDLYAGDASRRLGAAGLGSDMYLGERGLGQQATQAGMQNALDMNRFGGDMFNRGQDRSLAANQSLLSGGMQGAGQMGDMFSRINQAQQGAAGMVPDLNNMQWGNIDRMAGVGDQVQGLSEQELMDDIKRFNYYSQGPQDLMSNYAAIIQALGLNQSRGTGSSFSMSGYGGVGA